MHRSHSARAALVAFVAPLLAVGLPDAATAASPASEAVMDGAAAYLRGAQEPDGGFELADFPGFETPDAVLALAEAAQVDETWSPSESFASVVSAVDGGRTPLGALDDFVDRAATATDPGLSAGQAAKLILLDVVPLGLDPRAFDPDVDSGTTDLVAVLDAGLAPDGSYGAFNATLLAVQANALLERPTAPATLALVRAAQQADGGFNFAGDPAGTEEDVDTTAAAVQALVAAGVGPDDATLRRALGLLATTVNGDGSWGEPANPNSTAVAVLAVTAAGYDVNDSCWRDTSAFARVGQSYGSPDAYLQGLQAPDGHIASPFDAGGVTTFATSQTVQALGRRWLPVRRAPAQPCPVDGYGIVESTGTFGFGESPDSVEHEFEDRDERLVAGASGPGGDGYWLFSRDGSVFTVGDEVDFGSLDGRTLNAPIVGGAAAPDGQGYWMVAADGGVFAFGSARFFGSRGGRPLNEPIVGMAATDDGGYHLVASDGGIFTYGPARFYGSRGGRPLNQPIVGMASTPGGYWLVAADGGVFTFGAARFVGSRGGRPLNAPVVGMAGSPTGRGYQLVAADGGVFTFGDASFFGSAGGRGAGVVGIIPFA